MAGPRAPAPRAVAQEQWTVKTEDGQEYGPITKAELDNWVAEGRVGPQCQLLQAGASQWQWAVDVYPQLASSAAPAPPVRPATPAGAPGYDTGKPAAAPFAASDNPYAAPQFGAPQSSLRTRRVPDHLPLAIFSLVCCGGIVAVPAIIYAAQANSMKARGDYHGAARAASTAETWLYVSIGLGVLGNIVAGLMIAVGN